MSNKSSTLLIFPSPLLNKRMIIKTRVMILFIPDTARVMLIEVITLLSQGSQNCSFEFFHFVGDTPTLRNFPWVKVSRIFETSYSEKALTPLASQLVTAMTN